MLLPGEPSPQAVQPGASCSFTWCSLLPSPYPKPVIQVGKGLGPPGRFFILFLRLGASCFSLLTPPCPPLPLQRAIPGG